MNFFAVKGRLIILLYCARRVVGQTGDEDAGATAVGIQSTSTSELTDDGTNITESMTGNTTSYTDGLSNSTAYYYIAVPLPEYYLASIKVAEIIQSAVGPFSIVTNSLSLIVFIHMRRLKQHVLSVFIAIPIVDTFALTSQFIYLFSIVIHVNVVTSYNVGCQLANWIGPATQVCSAYLALLYTAERFISVRYPLKRAVICTRRRLHIAMGCVVVFAALLDVYNAILFIGTGGYCYTPIEYRQLYQILTLGLHMVIGIFVPYISIAILNALIVFQMIQYRRQRAALSTAVNSSADDATQRAMTTMLVVVSSYSVLANTPLIISWAISPFRVTDSNELTVFNIWAEQIFAPLTYCGNFFFYIVGGRQFRLEAMTMVGCAKLPGNKISIKFYSSVLNVDAF